LGLDTARDAIQGQQAALGRAFLDYAAAGGVHLDSPEAGLDALATFVSENKVHLILEEPFPDSPLERSSLGRKLTRLVARFITERWAQRFQDLTVAFDSLILFAAIDLMGVANGVAAKETLTLLRETGARTVAFDKTVWEMRNILAVYERLLATAGGRLSLHPTALTHHVLTTRLSSADINVISSTLEKRLDRVGVRIIKVPPHDPRFTLDEQALAEALKDPGNPETDTPRIRHDVDCIAGVLTLRGAGTVTSIERSGAIFCSSGGRVVSNAQQWFSTQGEHGIPPIVHQTALTSIAWLKKPAAAPDIKLHELAAVCWAVMRPTRETWNKFVQCLRNLRTDGSITDDETAALVSSELTEPALARLDEEFEPDSDSIQEAVERVRERYRSEASVAAGEVVRQARAEVALAQQAASSAVDRRDEVLGAVEARVMAASGQLAMALFVLGAVVITVAAVVSLPGVLDALGGVPKWAARITVICGAIFGVYSVIRGSSLNDLRASLKRRIAERLWHKWFPAGQAEFVAEERTPSARRLRGTVAGPSPPGDSAV
jgi:hypothetical protein